MTFKKSLLWDVTSRCNLRCKHCYNAEKYFNKVFEKNDLSLYQCKEVIDKIKKMKFDHIHLLGGEPLIREDIYDIIEYAVNAGITVTINTNGTLLSENNIDKLIESGISQITISLDSTIEEVNDDIRGKGTYQRVIKNILSLNEKLKNNDDVLVQIATVITKKNSKDIPEFPILLKKLGIKNISVLSLYSCGNVLKNKKELIDSLSTEIQCMKDLIMSIEEKNPELQLQLDCKPVVASYINRTLGSKNIELGKAQCYAGDKIWLLDSGGIFHPCSSCDLSTSEKSKEMGLLTNQAVNILDLNENEEIFNYEFYKSFKKLKENKTYNKKVCRACEFKDKCFGACPLVTQDNYNLCDYVMEEERGYFNSIKHKEINVSNDILMKKYDEKVVLYKITEGRLKEFCNWKADVLKKVGQANTALKIYKELSEKYPKVTELEFSRFILDLRSCLYIEL